MKPVAARDRRFLPSRLLSLAAIVLIAATIVAAAVVSWNFREAAIAHARQETSNLAVVIAEQTARSVQAVDLVLQEVQRRIPATQVRQQTSAEMSGEEFHHFLLARLRNLPQIQALGLIGPDGKTLNTTRAWPAPAIDASDRDFYLVLRDRPDPGVFISVPALSRITGQWSFFLARRISGPQGEFRGVVTAVVETRYFEEFYRAVASQPGQSVTIFRRDGIVLARYPHVEKMTGEKLSPEAPFYEFIAKGGGTYRTPGYIDGVARLVSLKSLRDFPLAVAVTFAEAEVLDAWRRQSLLIAIGTLCAVAAFGALLRHLAAQSRRLEQSEASLRASEARFRDFATTSSDWFWETDENHLFADGEEFNRPSDRVQGLFPLARTGTEPPTDAAGEADTPRQHDAVLDRRQPFRDLVYRLQSAEQPEQVISISGKPLFDEAGRFLGYRGTGRDITKEVASERRLRDAIATAEAADRAKSRFLANMSHELRTPLNAILGFSEILELGEIAGPLQPRQKGYIALIRQSGQHLLEIISDVLDLAKVSAGKLELFEEKGVDPRHIVDACLAIIRAQAQSSGVELTAKIDSAIPLVVADSTRMKQILLNLLSNAIKFTQAGGSVELLAYVARNGDVLFEVSDTGPGMTAGEIQVALEPFGQVDEGMARRHQGTGLGLPLARELAELHGGSLRIASWKDRGTTVTVVLPAKRVMSAKAAAKLLSRASAA